MPEGPSIVILREKSEAFIGKTVLAASGYAKIELERLQRHKITDIKSWGKHLLICFNGFFVRIHLMMFGSYRINERREGNPTLRLEFKTGEINFYTCQVKLMEGSPDDTYDWEADVMSGSWNAKKAEKKLKATKDYLVCDALLNQEIFAGSGNIIKNEVLFLTYIHPESTVDALPQKKLKELINTTRSYSFDFLKWKKINQLQRHWQIYSKKECPRCKIPSKIKYLGKGKRITYYCENCQEFFKH